MRAGFDKQWLLPIGTLAALVLVALGIVVFEPFFVGPIQVECAYEPTDNRP